MKTKDRRGRLQKNEPENMLITSELSKTAGKPNGDDKLFGQAERGVGRKRLSLTMRTAPAGLKPGATEAIFNA